MPYKTIKDLPENIRDVLPVHAQEIYMASFNNAHEEYHSKGKRRNPHESLEQVCHKVAWTAVKKKYKKDKNDKWAPKK